MVIKANTDFLRFKPKTKTEGLLDLNNNSTLGGIICVKYDCHLYIKYYKDIYKNYTSNILGLNSVLNEGDQVLRYIFQKYPSIWTLHLKGYDNEKSTLTVGYTNTIECTEIYTWIDNNDELSTLNFKAQSLFIENMAFNLKSYTFLIVQEDSKFHTLYFILKN